MQRGREAGQPREAVEAQRLEHQRQHPQKAQQEERRRRRQRVLHQPLHGVHFHVLVVPVAVVLRVAAAGVVRLLGLRDGAEGLRPAALLLLLLRRPQQPRRLRRHGGGHAPTASPR